MHKDFRERYSKGSDPTLGNLGNPLNLEQQLCFYKLTMNGKAGLHNQLLLKW
jgi:hypothetical protein